MLEKEIMRKKEELKVAENIFNNVTGEAVNGVIYEIMRIEQELEDLIIKSKATGKGHV